MVNDTEFVYGGNTLEDLESWQDANLGDDEDEMTEDEREQAEWDHTEMCDICELGYDVREGSYSYDIMGNGVAKPLQTRLQQLHRAKNGKWLPLNGKFSKLLKQESISCCEECDYALTYP